MRVTCACPTKTASEHLAENLAALGIKPIITPCVIRAVYEGPDRKLGEAILDLYQYELDHEVEVQFTKAEQEKQNKKAQRKANRANRNARLHGR